MENDTQDFIESHCLMTSMDKYNSKGQKMTHKDRKWPTRIESDPQGQKMTHKDRKWPAGARDFDAFLWIIYQAKVASFILWKLTSESHYFHIICKLNLTSSVLFSLSDTVILQFTSLDWFT